MLDVIKVVQGGGDSGCFPMVDQNFMNLYDHFEMELMVSFDSYARVLK